MFLPAVFFDRDGTLNIDPGYLSDPDKLELYSGVPEGIVLLKSLGFKVIVISNQSGIARGFFTRDVVESINNRINVLLAEFKTGIDAFYYCPYHPDFNSQEECKCRKPSPKLVLDAASEHNIDLKRSYFVGDSAADVGCGINAGIKTVLVKNTLSDEKISSLIKQGKIPNFIAENFKEVCDFIKNDFYGGI